MPVLARPTTELTDHVFFPIIRTVSHRLLEFFDYTEEIGDRIYINTDWSTHSKTDDIQKNAMLGQQAFRVDAQIRLNPTSQEWDCYTWHHTTAYGIGQRTLNDTQPVYLDKENRVRMVEMRSPVSIDLNCELILKSADLAYQTPQQIFNGHENGAIYHFNDFAFDYPVPKQIISVLYGLWKMDRIKGMPAGVDFCAYIGMHTGQGWQVHKHREKNEYELVVPVYDLKALATLKYSDDRPQAQMQDRLPIGFTIPFIYTIQFAMPTICLLQYPVVYNNQLVPEIYLPRSPNQRDNRTHERHIGYADENFDRQYRELHRYPDLLKTPDYDDWSTPGNNPAEKYRHMTVAIIHLLVDEDTETTTINLNDPVDSEISFSETTLNILREQGAGSMDLDAIFTVQLFKDDYPLKPGDDWNIDSDLKLTFKPADLQSHYRVTVSVAEALQYINSKWYDLLKKYFAGLNNGLKYQIIDSIYSGKWYNKAWRNYYLWVDPHNGDIYYRLDGKNRPYLGRYGRNYNANPVLGGLLANLNDTTWPYVVDGGIRSTNWIGGSGNANYTEARIFRTGIISRKR